MTRTLEPRRTGPATGDRTPIPVTRAGTVRVVPGTWTGSYQMQLLQADVAEQALAILDSREQSRTPVDQPTPALRDQRSYTHLETERAARLAQVAAASDIDTRRMVAALRDAARRSTSGR